MAKHDDMQALVGSVLVGGLEGYKQYVALGGTRNFNGWEVARRRIESAVQRVELKSVPPEVVPMGEFKGLHVGFWDIETTFSTQPIVLYAAIMDQFGRIQEFRKGEDITDDSALVASLADALEKYDIVCGWNSKLFDTPIVNARLTYHTGGRRKLITSKHIDLMYYASGQFNRLGRRSLQSVSEYFEVDNKKTPLRVKQWDGAMAGKAEYYENIAEHCNADVAVLRDVFDVLKIHIVNIHR